MKKIMATGLLTTAGLAAGVGVSDVQLAESSLVGNPVQVTFTLDGPAIVTVRFFTNEVADAIGLRNVEAVHLRGEEEKGKYDFIVSRAVMPLPDLMKIVRKNISKSQHNAMMNGVICLKGGNVENEIQPFRRTAEVIPISTWFNEEWFKEKYLIYIGV